MNTATNRWASTTRSLERNLSGKSSLTSVFKNRDTERATLEGKAVSVREYFLQEKISIL